MDGRGLGAFVERVSDGDTLELVYSLEFGIVRRARARLIGVDTAETFGRAPGSTERVDGERQSAFVRDWVAAGVTPPRQAWPFVALVHGADKYGRDLVDLVRVRDGRSLVADLVGAFPSVAQGARLAGSG